MRGSSTDPLLSKTSAALLRQRATRYGLLGATFAGAFLLSRVASALATGEEERLWSISVLAHALGVASMIALVVVSRDERAPAHMVRRAELVCTALACAAYCMLVLGLPQVFRPDVKLAQGLSIQLLGRAIYVPSSARRTGLLALLVTAPYTAALFWTFWDIDPSFLESMRAANEAAVTPSRLRFELIGEDLLWWVGSAALATWVSGVIYGLRREVRRATQLGQYTLEQKLGEGGMGVVYRAQHGLLRRPTAIKLLRPTRVGEAGLARFEREVRATAALSHPNTVTIFDYGHTDDGTFYYAMELLHGATLTQVVELAGPLPPGRVIHVLAQVAAALSEAHDARLIHRDIKPDNILLTRHGGIPDHVKVLDFGLVKDLDVREDVDLTHENSILGTPLYLPPECIRGRALDDGRSDLYSLGAVAYYLITGEHVFSGDTVVEVCSKHLERAPEPPSERLGRPVPADLERLVLACLAKDPADRPASARVLEEQLRACADATAWSRLDAERWWHDFEPELLPAIDPLSDTVAVKLAPRAS